MQVFRNKILLVGENILMGAQKIPKIRIILPKPKTTHPKDAFETEPKYQRFTKNSSIETTRSISIDESSQENFDVSCYRMKFPSSSKGSISKFLEQISSVSDISDQQLKLAIYLFVLIVREFGTEIEHIPWYCFKLFSGCMILAHRFLDDINFCQEDLAQILGLNKKSLPEIELTTLQLYLRIGGENNILELNRCWTEVVYISREITKPANFA